MVVGVVVVAIAEGLEVDVGRELHGAVWKAMRHSMLAWALVVVWVGLGLVPGELMEAFHTEMLHLVAGGLSRRLGFGHASHHFREDAAQNGLTFGVWGVWRDRDGLGRVEDELDDFSFQLWKRDDRGEGLL